MNRIVQPVAGFTGTISVPPDKSIAHRMVMFASMADGVSHISNFSLARDPQSSLACMRALGVKIEGEGTEITVFGEGRDALKSPAGPLDCGNSGTTMRLLSGIISGAGLETTLIGDESLSRRTMKRIADPLTKMGASISLGSSGFPPVTIGQGKGLQGIRYTLPVASAQVKSCVLLAGLFAAGPTTVVEPVPTRDHTERLLGLSVAQSSEGRVIQTSRSTPVPLQNGAVPGDFSAATFWLVAGSVIPGSAIVLKNVGMNPTRIAALHVLKRMGADIEPLREFTLNSEPCADLSVRYAHLKATEILQSEIPNLIDELPVLGVAMRFAEGTSRFRGAEELRHKECDRLSAMVQMLSASGAGISEVSDGMDIAGHPENRNYKTRFESWLDHRIVMSAAVLSAASRFPNEVTHADEAAVSYPDFWNHFDSLSS